MATPAVSKRRSIKLEEKRLIIWLIESKAKTQADIVREYGLNKATVSMIWKKRDRYKSVVTFSDSSKKMRKSIYEDVEDAVFHWLKHARSVGIPVSGPLMKAKAAKFATALGHSKFSCSDGWLDRFKKRHNLSFHVLNGGVVPQELAKDWLENKLPHLLDHYETRNIFNADETGLFFKLLPDRTTTFKGDACHGGKRSEDRLTLLLATNMNGSEKLPLLAIGKTAKPRCFKGVKLLPVQYKHNRKAWMTGNLFTEWLLNLDRKFLRENRRVLMIVDNCSAHDPAAAERLEAIQLEFLPFNCSSLLQPCNMGIIQDFKLLYRKQLLQKLFAAIDDNDMDNFSVDVLQSLRWARLAWDRVTATSITDCFMKAGFIKTDLPATSTEIVDDQPEPSASSYDHDFGKIFEQLMLHFPNQCPTILEDFLWVDDNVQTAPGLTDEDIVAEVKAKSADVNNVQSDEKSSDDDSQDLPVPTPSSHEVHKALSLVQHYLERTGSAQDGSELMMTYVGKLDAHIAKLAGRDTIPKTVDGFSKR
ncbi:tigger transposable element-derived protein 4-like [Hyperolius riggenbachi]|uniref:tigger transposable element-derived protein 4-like n=1 Tax=Hyperolius riggenbachi TaxID=752182 RepID=UPI0035A311E3